MGDVVNILNCLNFQEQFPGINFRLANLKKRNFLKISISMGTEPMTSEPGGGHASHCTTTALSTVHVHWIWIQYHKNAAASEYISNTRDNPQLSALLAWGKPATYQ